MSESMSCLTPSTILYILFTKYLTQAQDKHTLAIRTRLVHSHVDISYNNNNMHVPAYTCCTQTTEAIFMCLTRSINIITFLLAKKATDNLCACNIWEHTCIDKCLDDDTNLKLIRLNCYGYTCKSPNSWFYSSKNSIVLNVYQLDSKFQCTWRIHLM